jgi:hypothetical protein
MGYVDVEELLHYKLVMIARQFGARDNARSVAMQRQSREKHAVSGEMLQHMHSTYWCTALTSGDAAVVDRAVACLIGWATFEWGLRIGNLAKTVSDRQQSIRRNEQEISGGWSLREDIEQEYDSHAIRANEIMLEVEEEDGRRTCVTAFQYSQASFPRREARALTLTFVSSKTNQRGSRTG